MSAAPSIVAFRDQVRAELGEHRGPVIVLAVDGIPYDLACEAWRGAQVRELRSVFPTTSSTAWLSCLTGTTVDQHGVPGVVFAGDDGALIDVYAYQGSLGAAPPEDLFTDSARAGLAPVAVLGDLEDTRCTWRDWLVRHAQVVHGHRFFWAPDVHGDLSALGDRLVTAIDAALAAQPGTALVWCFLDADRHIHHHGYDPALLAFLARIDDLARAWARSGALVIAHSDHGLVPTRHDPDLAAALAAVCAAHDCTMGGAGRTRWLYVAPDAEAAVADELRRCLPWSVRLRHADELFAPGSLARSRVGALVLIAEGEAFLAGDGYMYEHGSLTERELAVPFATWRPC